MAEITWNNRKIGDGHPVYIIAEMSANHAGSLERAKQIVHKAKESGADCIKIQTYTPDTLTIDCHNPYFEVSNGTWQGENLYSLYGKAYTPWEWQKEIMEEAKRVGIDFLSTPFDRTAVDFLEDLGVDFYKIGSFEIVDLPFLSYVASKGKPIILSTGMASLEEIREAVETVYQRLSGSAPGYEPGYHTGYEGAFRPAGGAFGSLHGIYERRDVGGPGRLRD